MLPVICDQLKSMMKYLVKVGFVKTTNKSVDFLNKKTSTKHLNILRENIYFNYVLRVD